MTLVRRGVALLDFVLFVKELFGSQYNSPKSQRVREVAASYAAYHDQVWMGHGEYDQLFQGEYGTFVRFWHGTRTLQARLHVDPTTVYDTAPQSLLRVGVSYLPVNASLASQVGAIATSPSYAQQTQQRQEQGLGSHLQPQSPDGRMDITPTFASNNGSGPPSEPASQNNTATDSQPASRLLPHMQGMLNEQLGVNGHTQSSSQPNNWNVQMHASGSNITPNFNFSAAPSTQPPPSSQNTSQIKAATGTRGSRKR